MWRHLVTENPLCGREGIARRRHGLIAVWWGVARVAAVSYGLASLLIVWFGLPPDPEDLWILHALAPYFGAMLIPAVLMPLLPRSDALRAVLVQLRLAGLTPGQITVGHLFRAGQALVRFHLLWFGVLLAALWLLWEDLGRQFDWDADTFLLYLVIFAGIADPWLLLAMAWPIFAVTGKTSAVLVVTMPVAIALSPLGMFLMLASMTAGGPPFDDETLLALEAVSLAAKCALAAAVLHRFHRRFDDVISARA